MHEKVPFKVSQFLCLLLFVPLIHHTTAISFSLCDYCKQSYQGQKILESLRKKREKINNMRYLRLDSTYEQDKKRES